MDPTIGSWSMRIVRVPMAALMLLFAVMPLRAAPARPPAAPGCLAVRVAPAEQGAEARPGEVRLRLPVRDLRDGDLLLGVARSWQIDAPFVHCASVEDARALRFTREDCLVGRAPVLIARAGVPVWLAGARDGWGTTVRIREAAIDEALRALIDQARADPLAGLTPAERRKRQGLATPEIEFGPLADAAAPTATPAWAAFPADPMPDAYYPCSLLTEEWSPRAGLRVRTYGEARALVYPEEDGTAARAGVRAWLGAYADALEAEGYARAEEHHGSEAGLTRAWSVCLLRNARVDDEQPMAPGVIRRVVELGYLESGLYLRRVSELIADSEADRAAYAECLPFLGRVEWPLSRRLRNLRVPVRKHGEALVSELAEAYEHQRAGQAVPRGARLTAPVYDGWDPLWDAPESPEFHDAVAAAVKAACARYRVSEEQVSVGLCDPHTDEYGMYRGDTMRYAACVCKLLIILAVFEEEANGKLAITRDMEVAMSRMIRLSSMPEAGEIARRVGIGRILEIAQSPRYRLYDKERGGGMWTGRYYWGGNAQTFRDPVAHLSHGVNARQVLRYYWMLDHGLLVSPEACRRMESIFLDESVCGILNNKIVHALLPRGVSFIRKSGWYPPQQNDSALITGPDRQYILCVFVRSGAGDQVIEEITRRLDDFMIARAHPERAESGDADEPVRE